VKVLTPPKDTVKENLQNQIQISVTLIWFKLVQIMYVKEIHVIIASETQVRTTQD
jgi:hypothetical protein